MEITRTSFSVLATVGASMVHLFVMVTGIAQMAQMNIVISVSHSTTVFLLSPSIAVFRRLRFSLLTLCAL